MSGAIARSGREAGRSAGAPLRILGLDPSLTSFGAARVCSDAAEPVLLHRWQPGSMRGHERLEFLLGKVEWAARRCDFAVIEGVVASALGAETHLNLAGLHWLVRHRLWLMGVPCAVVQPSVRMKYLTGKGRADKDVCLLAVARRFPDIEVDGNDTADAFTLAAMGADWAGFALAEMPAEQRAVLTATKTVRKVTRPVIDWPDLKGRQHAVTG